MQIVYNHGMLVLLKCEILLCPSVMQTLTMLYLLHCKQVRQQVQEGAWARRSENTVLTALVRLASLHEPLRAALSHQVPFECHSRGI